MYRIWIGGYALYIHPTPDGVSPIRRVKDGAASLSRTDAPRLRDRMRIGLLSVSLVFIRMLPAGHIPPPPEPLLLI